MGIFDRMMHAISGGESGETPDSNEHPETLGDVSIPDWAFTDPAHVDGRSQIIAAHYDVDEETAHAIAVVIKEHLETNDTISGSALEDAVAGAVDIPSDLVKQIVRTELSSIQVLQRVLGYLERERPGDVYRWMGPTDSRTHPICREVAEITEKAGGLPLEDLMQLLADQAQEYEDRGGTPDRMGHWVPHEECRFTVARHLEP